MPARSPDELDRLFSEAVNARNLDALMALYEPEAALTPRPGQVVSGTPAIREALGGLLATKPTLTLEVKTLARTRDVALTSARWESTGTRPDGSPTRSTGHSVEVSRLQADGTWRFVIDNPWGLEWDA
jgi:uncharacterized protein (TIGR02246 family)